MTIHDVVVICCDGPGVPGSNNCHTKETHMVQTTDRDVARADAESKGWAFNGTETAMCPLCYEIHNTVGGSL